MRRAVVTVPQGRVRTGSGDRSATLAISLHFTREIANVADRSPDIGYLPTFHQGRTCIRRVPFRNHSAFAPENPTTLAHFSISDPMKLLKSAVDSGIGAPPRSTSLFLNCASASAALISLFSFSTTADGVALGAPMPNHAVAS